MSSILNATTSSGLQIAPDNSGSLQLQTNNGTTALTIDTSQNVGIGTATPTAGFRIQAVNTGGLNVIASTSSDASGATVYMQANGSTAGVFGTLGNHPQTFVTNNTERMRIDTSGNVGIGTTSPIGKFDVGGASTAASNTTAYIHGTDNASYGQALAFRRNGSNSFVIGDSGAILGSGGGATVLYTYGANHQAYYTNGTERMRIDSSGYVQGTVNGLSAGRMLAWQYYRLNSGYAGSNATGAQSLFGVGVTLVGSTVYEFEAIINLTKSAGTTSHTIALGFGGTATLNNIGFFANLTGGTTAATQSAAQNIIVGSSASSTVITGALSNATYFFTIIIKGTVSVNAGGTFIPQYTLSAAPGGAYTTAIGSYIKIAPLSASGANTNIGSWA